MFLDLEESFDAGHLGEIKFVFPDLFEDVIDFGQDIFASFDVIVEGFVETVGSGIDELDAFLGGHFWNCVVGLLSRDEQLVVPHGGWPEERH